ncbi:MAG: ABC transporter permease subunit [Anaerolineales bacterium]|jgi:ABC-2 type transport system permease protein
MKKIKTIVGKEWAEVFKTRMVLFTVAFLPLLMAALPLVILHATRSSGAGNPIGNNLPQQYSTICPANLSGSDCLQVALVSEFMLLFMIIPVAVPVTISAYSIVGEKTTRSLEPLLATPITTGELLVGKCLAALIPAVVATDGAFLIYAVGAVVMTHSGILLSAVLDIRWLIAVFVVGPLMAFLAIMVSIIVSSRVNDPRVAEQLSMVVIVPVLGLFFAQVSGLLLINRQLILLLAVLLAAIDILIGLLGVHLFQREVILTRWK